MITGYEDDSFGPDDYLTRAQLATVLGRYEDYRLRYTAQMLFDLENLESSELSYRAKVALVLAQAKYLYLPSGEPEGLETCTLMNEGGSVFGAYDVYDCTGLFTQYYVHHNYEGGIPESGVHGEIDRWYGPYVEDFSFL